MVKLGCLNRKILLDSKLKVFGLSRPLNRLWFHISQSRRRQLLVLLILTIIASFFEFLSLGAVLPFLSILSEPESIGNLKFGNLSFSVLSGLSSRDSLLVLTIAFSFAALISALMRFLLFKMQTNISFGIGSDFSLNMYKKTLNQPYSYHIEKNSSELMSGILTKAKSIVGGTLIPLLSIFSGGILVLALMSTLVFFEPLLTTALVVGILTIYIVILKIIRKKINKYSATINQSHSQLVKTINEGLGNIRDVIIDGAQEQFSEHYKEIDRKLRSSMGNLQIASVSPRFGIEALGIVLISFLAYFFSSSGFLDAKNLIPSLGLIAFGSQKILPMLQQIYSSYVILQGNTYSLADCLEVLDLEFEDRLELSNQYKMPFNKSIIFENVSFSYPSARAKTVLNEINFSIPKGSRVGVIGLTGGGKSTLLDIIMGLLLPTHGRIMIDGIEITKVNQRSWRKLITHVPQSVFLADSSVAENIAFGVLKSDIDMQRVIQAAKKSKLHEEIQLMDGGYDAVVGERGVKLSGGQIQRIGIARALYREHPVIVLDEATSALDEVTESFIMESFKKLGSSVTILIVAHRLTTLKFCDFILEIDGGKAVNVGTFEEVFSNRP
jgi:ABC-type multidrug transport system fused ATPase/permease subunit